MTEVQVIPTAIDINVTARVTEEKRNVHGSVNARAALLSVTTSLLETTVPPTGFLSSPADDATFLGNGPQLFQGHADFHIRNGIIRAALASDAQKANAETAFFVADLGQVYKQHLRWKECLPNVEPFYGR